MERCCEAELFRARMGQKARFLFIWRAFPRATKILIITRHDKRGAFERHKRSFWISPLVVSVEKPN